MKKIIFKNRTNAGGKQIDTTRCSHQRELNQGGTTELNTNGMNK